MDNDETKLDMVLTERTRQREAGVYARKVELARKVWAKIKGHYSSNR